MTRTDRDDIFGRGWGFPVRTDTRGVVESVEGERNVREAIRIVLGTAKGERVMRPEFGCDIHDYAFDVVDTTTLTLISTAVREALERWEPRIDVERVDTSTEELSRGRLLIDVRYRLQQSGVPGSVIYPLEVGG